MLHAKGFHVQLKHDPTETSFQAPDHGYVVILGADGAQLAREERVQHKVAHLAALTERRLDVICKITNCKLRL